MADEKKQVALPKEFFCTNAQSGYVYESFRKGPSFSPDIIRLIERRPQFWRSKAPIEKPKKKIVIFSDTLLDSLKLELLIKLKQEGFLFFYLSKERYFMSFNKILETEDTFSILLNLDTFFSHSQSAFTDVIKSQLIAKGLDLERFLVLDHYEFEKLLYQLASENSPYFDNLCLDESDSSSTSKKRKYKSPEINYRLELHSFEMMNGLEKASTLTKIDPLILIKTDPPHLPI